MSNGITQEEFEARRREQELRILRVKADATVWVHAILIVAMLYALLLGVTAGVGRVAGWW